MPSFSVRPPLCPPPAGCMKRLHVVAAEAMGLPLLPPYLDGWRVGELRKGVNFAVAGATAMDNEFFEEKGITTGSTNSSLRFQIRWFQQLLPSLCSSPTGLPFHSLLRRRLLSPSHIDRAEDYDAIGCLRWLNEFSQYHNGQLHDELRRLQAVHPEVVIIYADYYRAMMNIFSNPDGFGIKERFLACCGGGGPYNYNSSRPCGSEGQTVCDDTWTYLHWDGLHMTEATYGIVSVGLLQGPFATPAIATTCPATRFSLTHPSSSS
ncbi:hypothetical protein B296_00027238 [Ensete ventricosum]|uniref:GDSL esterase/lipase n=1 Tax=Ensete ventricosum TaxID=4639 RepID=A0A426YXU7_ENSVE|nr:hypothetical protein B296_00027238 [Ensete ventricosum]